MINQPLSAALPQYEFVADTECGRHFIWSASSMETCLARMTEKGYRLKFIMELSEYERMIADQQREMVIEITHHIEKGVA